MYLQRFDEFARLIGHSRSRRNVFKILAGGLAAGFLGVAGHGRAAAQTCGALGDACTGNTDCCTGLTCFEAVCDNPNGACGALGDACTGNADCCNGLTCFEALCDNPSGLCQDEGEFCGSVGLECCEGLDCTDDYCASTALPNTGSGSAADRGISSSLLGAGVAAGAAAVLAGRRLRPQEAPVVNDRS